MVMANGAGQPARFDGAGWAHRAGQRFGGRVMVTQAVECACGVGGTPDHAMEWQPAGALWAHVTAGKGGA